MPLRFPPLFASADAPLAAGLVGAVGLLLILYGVQVRTRNAGWVDVGWTLALGALALVYAITGEGDANRRILIGLVGGLWSLRLVIHLLTDRVLGQPEESRYQRMRRWLGDRAAAGFFVFFLLQGLLAFGLAFVFWLGCQDPTPIPVGTDIAAGVLLLISLAGEALADRQLSRFRRRDGNDGEVCREGLWGWSRHPNYFFTWLVWVAFALLSVQSPFGPWSLLAPAVMLVLILKVTGIPPTELQAVAKRGEKYRRYQREVSAFVPLPPRTQESP